MRGLWKLTWTEIKLYIREPVAAFFTLGFPLILLFAFGSIWGNRPSPFFGGFGYIDTLIPAYTAAIIATSGLMSLSITMSTYREYGILRRLQATPLRAQTILTAQVIMLLLMTTLGTILLITAGKIIYGLRFGGNAFYVIFAFILSCFSFFSLGFVIAGVLPTARTAQAVAMILFYPMVFLSGATIPREILPMSVRKFAQVLPLTYVVNLMRGLWIGNGLEKHLTEIAILLLLIVVCVIISAKTFRWE